MASDNLTMARYTKGSLHCFVCKSEWLIRYTAARTALISQCMCITNINPWGELRSTLRDSNDLCCRRVGSQSAKQWLDRLQREKVPVLVCLTFADKFYAEHMSEGGQHPKKETMKYHLEDQLIVSHAQNSIIIEHTLCCVLYEMEQVFFA